MAKPQGAPNARPSPSCCSTCCALAGSPFRASIPASRPTLDRCQGSERDSFFGICQRFRQVLPGYVQCLQCVSGHEVGFELEDFVRFPGGFPAFAGRPEQDRESNSDNEVQRIFFERLPVLKLGQSEIEEHGAFGGDHDVGRLQIAVQDAASVGLFQRGGNLESQGGRRLFAWKRSVPGVCLRCIRAPGSRGRYRKSGGCADGSARRWREPPARSAPRAGLSAA